MIKMFRIPKKVKLPGATVRVEIVHPDKLDENADAEWLYLEDQPTIRISSKVSKKRQRYLLYHELMHALHDLMHVALQDHKKEVAP